MKVKEFMESTEGGYVLIADRDFSTDYSGEYKEGDEIYFCYEELTVIRYLYQPLNGMYTLFVGQ